MLVKIVSICRGGSQNRGGGCTMKNPLESIWGTIISGLVLTVVLVVAAKSLLT